LGLLISCKPQEKPKTIQPTACSTTGRQLWQEQEQAI